MKQKLITTYILSLIDLAFTLYLTFHFGEIETNPFGIMLLSNPILAVIYKVGVVGIACLLLYKCKGYKLVRIATNIIMIAYSLLAIYHTVLISYTHYILFL